MKISKNNSLEWIEYLSKLPKDDVEKFYENENIIDAIFMQIEEAVEHNLKPLEDSIIGLKTLENKTLFVGNEDKFPKGCKSCLCGDGLNAIRKTNKCNLKCKFCYYYDEIDNQKSISDGIWKIGGMKIYEKDINQLISMNKDLSGVSYAYLEPFIEIEKYYSIIRNFSIGKIHQHMYTNGTLVTEENLKRLGESGLDEIRFNLGATNCSDNVINNMKLAKKYIKYVGIETPMTYEFYDKFMAKKEKILDTGFDFINCAELHLTENNYKNYFGENLYLYRQGYVSPIWSRELTLKFMKIADDEKWDIVVHDCSNKTKYARDMHYTKSLSMWFGASSYGIDLNEIPYEYFIPLLRAPKFNFIEEDIFNIKVPKI